MPIYIPIIIGAVAVTGAIAGAASYYEYHGIGPQEGISRKGSMSSGKKAVLSFDDGPSARYTPQILDILRKEEIKAVFFLTGRLVETHPDIVRRIRNDGHEIGNHTYSHVNLVFLRNEAWREEILRGEAAIAGVTGSRPQLFRPPRCLLNNEIRQFLLDRGYKIILWSVSAADWLPLSRDFVVWRVRHFTKPGSIILFHDGGALIRNQGGKRDNTVKSLEAVIKSLRQDGYEFASLSEVL